MMSLRFFSLILVFIVFLSVLDCSAAKGLGFHSLGQRTKGGVTSQQSWQELEDQAQKRGLRKLKDTFLKLGKIYKGKHRNEIERALRALTAVSKDL